MNVVGISSCSGGWAAVKVNYYSWDVKIFKSLRELIYANCECELFIVNVPIGILNGSNNERSCDNHARVILGDDDYIEIPFAPCREALYCGSFGVANVINKRLTGKYLSPQMWALSDKIKELDKLLIENIAFREKLIECNVEIAFYSISGKKNKNNKTLLSGYTERRNILAKIYPKTEEIINYSIENFQRKELKMHNVLDALCLALNGINGLKYGFIKIPSDLEYDNFGIRMQIEIANYKEIFEKGVNDL